MGHTRTHQQGEPLSSRSGGEPGAVSLCVCGVNVGGGVADVRWLNI